MRADTATLVELLRQRADRSPSKTAFRFLADGEKESDSITYSQLDLRARDLAARLLALGIAGRCVLLVFPAGLDFIVAFFGCLYASAIAVPCLPPRANQSLGRLQAIARNAQASWALTSAAQLADFEQRSRDDFELSQLRWMALPSSEAADADLWKPPPVTPQSLAFLQYTSGSTGSPKGVMLTHRNLLHNEQMIQAAFGHGPNTVVAGWLPQFHDMGLIGNVLQPVFVGVPCVLIPPMAFLQRPARWLRMISDHQATTSGGPNFAYELCARKITDEQLEGVDLSSWRLAFCGAEPVRADTLELFADRFAAHGFLREAFYPCYGLAEATLFIAGPKAGEPTQVFRLARPRLAERWVECASGSHSDEAIQTLVGCGRSNDSQRIAIVDPKHSVRCPPGEVGEIWVSGPSVAAGYWNAPALSKATFSACLEDEPGRLYLRTGDLGAFVNGQLVICGRLKDVVIIRGRNHAAEDIEWSAARALKGESAGSGVAFSVPGDGGERLVLVQEVDRKALRAAGREVLAARLRRVIAQEHGLQLSDLVFVKLASVPRTSSGKVQRHRCREQYEAGTLSRLVLNAPTEPGLAVPTSSPREAEPMFLEES
ncbi:MAG: fatty acyl-AMP ligase [Burkholderiaceae bacterium]